MQPGGRAQVDPQLIAAVTASVMQSMQNAGVAQKAPDQKVDTDRQPKTIDLLGLMFYVLEKFWIVLLSALVCAAVFGYSAYVSVPSYTATSKLYIVNPNSTGINIADLQLGTVLALDYQEVFKTWEVHELVREELQLPYSYDVMQSMIRVTNPEDTRILYISATYPDAQMAADIANAYAKAAKTFIINTMRAEEPSDFSIALVPGTAQTVGKLSSIIKGFLLGSVLAVGVLTLLFVLDERPRTPESISMYGGIPTLAVLPSVKDVRRINRQSRRHRKRRGEN